MKKDLFAHAPYVMIRIKDTIPLIRIYACDINEILNSVLHRVLFDKKPSLRYVGRYLYILRNFVIIRRWQSIDTIIIFDRFRGLITHAHYSIRSSSLTRKGGLSAFIGTEFYTTRVASRFLTICWGFQRSTVNLIPRIRGAIFIVGLRDVLSILPLSFSLWYRAV